MDNRKHMGKDKNGAILQKQEERIWYAQKTIENGWSSNVLDLQIQSRLFERSGKSVNNFAIALPPVDSDMENQIFKAPYLFDFLGTGIFPVYFNGEETQELSWDNEITVERRHAI